MLQEMRTFVLFSQERSIQRVAERLPLTQPAVTRQIQRLEQELGAELLDRRMKPPGLTPAGIVALSRITQILAAYDDMKNIAGRSRPEGVLRLGVARGLADRGLARVVKSVCDWFPLVSMRLTTGWSEGLAERLRHGVLDAAIVLSPRGAPDEGEIIGRESLVVISGGDNAETAPEMQACLSGQSWVLSPEPCDARGMLSGVLSRRGIRLNVAAEVEDAGLQLALVREGFGLSLLPSRVLAQQRPAGVVALALDDQEFTLDVRVLRSPHLQGLAEVVDAISIRLRTTLLEQPSL